MLLAQRFLFVFEFLGVRILGNVCIAACPLSLELILKSLCFFLLGKRTVVVRDYNTRSGRQQCC